jgi:phage baseplate assembly protein gpV
MASTFSTDLKLELVATGEKAGLWGTITNTNLQILEQSVSGYLDLSMASGSVTLLLSDGASSNGKNFYLKLSGNLSTNTTLTMPSGSERVWVISDETDRTSSKYTLSVTTASGTAQPVPVGATLLCVSDGTNTVTRIIQKGYYSIDSSSITAYTAVAGDQILVNTTSNPVTITLPASPSTGDEIFILDARGTFAANNLTVGRNAQPIMSNGSDLTLSTSGQTVNLVYVDSTRGWAYRSAYL